MRVDAKPYVSGTCIGRLVYWWEELADLSEAVPIIRDVTQKDMLDLVRKHPAGVVVVGQRRFSHVLTYLFAQSIPAVIVDEAGTLPDGDWCYLDGAIGALECGRTRASLPSVCEGGLPALLPKKLPAAGSVATLDGERIILEASINDAVGAGQARTLGAAAIGLVRTEFLIASAETPPTVDDYARAAQALISAAGGLGVTWRLLDLGAEKLPSWLRSTRGLRDPMGLRGCRAYRVPRVRSAVQAQTEAILAADTRPDCTLLLPYVSSFEEFRDARAAFGRARAGKQPRFGAMLETPAACLQAASFIETADVVAIGTSDLVATFFGASRNLSEVAGYLDPYAPALVRFLSLIAGLRPESTRSIRVCGQLPLLPHALEYMLGLGFRRFSLEPSALLSIADRCTRVDTGVMAAACADVATRRTSADALECLMEAADSSRSARSRATP